MGAAVEDVVGALGALVKIGTDAGTGVTVGALAGVRVGALAGPSVGALAGPSVGALTGATVVVPLDSGADTTGADLGAMVIEIGQTPAAFGEQC
jgi:hypothetical protein